MKTLIKIIIVTLLTNIFLSCHDDSEIQNQIEILNSKVASLEQLISQMNTNISALQTVLTALQNNDYVTSISDIKDGNVVIGYALTFAKSGIINIYHGINGSTPVIGVKIFEDGQYYWTINDDWVTNDQGGKINAEGKDGITPKLKIENGKWFLSIDNGVTWTETGKATGNDGDTFFNIITEDENNVYLILANGTVITISKDKPLSITFDGVEYVTIRAGETKTVNYLIDGASASTVIKAVTQNGWKANVIPTDYKSGKILITAPSPLIQDEILILVSDGEKTIMQTINYFTDTSNRILDLDSLYISRPSDAERDDIISLFNITLYDGEESNAKWNLYDAYDFNPYSGNPSIYPLVNSLRVIREQKFSEPLPFTDDAYSYMLDRLKIGGIDLSLRTTGYNSFGGHRIHLMSHAAFWDGRTSTDPLNPSPVLNIGAYIYLIQLLLHEIRHSDPDDPGHDPVYIGKDTRFSLEGAYARGAIYYMWIYKYGINNNEKYKREAKFEATYMLKYRFVEMPPTHPNPKIQDIIDELLGN